MVASSIGESSNSEIKRDLNRASGILTALHVMEQMLVRGVNRYNTPLSIKESSESHPFLVAFSDILGSAAMKLLRESVARITEYRVEVHNDPATGDPCYHVVYYKNDASTVHVVRFDQKDVFGHADMDALREPVARHMCVDAPRGPLESGDEEDDYHLPSEEDVGVLELGIMGAQIAPRRGAPRGVPMESSSDDGDVFFAANLNVVRFGDVGAVDAALEDSLDLVLEPMDMLPDSEGAIAAVGQRRDLPTGYLHLDDVGAPIVVPPACGQCQGPLDGPPDGFYPFVVADALQLHRLALDDVYRAIKSFGFRPPVSGQRKMTLDQSKGVLAKLLRNESINLNVLDLNKPPRPLGLKLLAYTLECTQCHVTYHATCAGHHSTLSESARVAWRCLSCMYPRFDCCCHCRTAGLVLIPPLAPDSFCRNWLLSTLLMG
jgi:hypothetical protein